MGTDERKKRELVERSSSPYRLDLEPGVAGRRLQWNLVFISDHPVTVDFSHTDMLEKVIEIRKANLKDRKKDKEEGEELRDDRTTEESG